MFVCTAINVLLLGNSDKNLPNICFMFVCQEFLDFRQRRNQMLRYRKNQILLAFSFWGPIEPREPKWTYELRSYTLKVRRNRTGSNVHKTVVSRWTAAQQVE